MKGLRLRMADRLAPTLRRVGRDRNPVLVVDDFLANPDEIRARALDSRFRRGDHLRYYPGYQADCALPGIDEITAWVARRMWTEGFGHRPSPTLDLADCPRPLFSAMSPAPGATYLNIHVDGHSWLAVLLYLSKDSERTSGTAFWRQREHGLESMYLGPNPMKQMSVIDHVFGTRMLDKVLRPLGRSPASTFEQFANGLCERDVRPPFPERSHGVWQRTGIVRARYNRLVAYPTWMWHSATQRTYEPPRTLAAARLTLNMFIRHPVLEPRSLVPITPIGDLP
ncbi:MAG: DUF6445 family protein [Deltaproteobacteria bacterium]|nr:DUF6445 family protein [Deltaproteobacteria bacterium]